VEEKAEDETIQDDDAINNINNYQSQSSITTNNSGENPN
jgi:hypothetical protein